MKWIKVVALICLAWPFTANGQTPIGPDKRLLTRPLSTASATVASDDLEVWMGDSGNFTMGVPDGPILIFGHPNSTTSRSTVRIDNVDYENFQWAPVQAPTVQGLAVSGKWLINNQVLLTLTITIAESTPASGIFDTGRIAYELVNQDVAAHDIAVRLMIDTMLNFNDGAPLRVAGFEAIEVETDFVDNDVPSIWEAFDSLLDPTVIAKGNLISGLTTRPDRFIAGQWGNLVSTSWDYTVDPLREITDSAVAIYWEPTRINANGSRSVTTTYGLGELNLARIGPLQIGVTALGALESDPIGQRSPNPFNVNLFLQNDNSSEADTVTNISGRLHVPNGLVVTDGDTTRLFADMLPGESFQTSWEVFAEDSTVGTLPYSLEIMTDDGSEIIALSVVVPKLEDLGAISGIISRADNGFPIEGASVTSTFGQTGTSDENGIYVVPRLEAGSGYSVTATAAGFIPISVDSITVTAGVILNLDIALTPSPDIDYKVISLSPDPNPPGLSFVMDGGTANRYYQVFEKDSGRISKVPVTVQVEPLGLVISQADGILKIPVRARDVGDVGTTQSYIITQVSGRDLPFDERIDFGVRVLPRSYEVNWTSPLFGGPGYVHRNPVQGNATQLSLSGVNIAPDGADFDKVRITRQLRGPESLTSAISGRIGVQLTDVHLSNGLRGDVTGSVSTLSTDVYEASYSPNLFDLSSEDASTRFIVLNDGLAGSLSPRLTAVLGHATRSYSSTVSLDDFYQGSARALDMRQGSLAGGSFRLDVQDQTILPTNAFDVQVGANIGAGGHLVVNGSEYVDRQESGFQLSITGTVSDQAPLGDGLNFRNRPWNDFATAEFSNFLGLFGPDGEISFNGTLSGGVESITDANGNLKRLEIQVIKEEVLQTSPILLSRRESVYEISADADRLRSIASTVVPGPALLDFISGTPSRFEFEANTFSSILHRFFTRIYGFRRDVNVDYTVHETVQEEQPDSSFQVTVESDGVPTQLQLRVGTNILKGKRLKAESGVWINGRHLALEEYLDDQNTPQIAPSFQDIESYLLDQMEDTFDDAFSHTVVTAASGQKLALQTTNALLTIPKNVLAAGTAVGNLNWSFYGSNSSVSTRGLPARTRKLSDGIRNKALEATGLRYGIGGFHQLTPERTALDVLATLAITYDDQDITGLNEADLRIYANKGDVGNWFLVGGTVDVASNTVTASIDTFWTFTVAPLAPGGNLVLAIDPDTLFAGASDTAHVTSMAILSVDSTTVAEGTQVTILTDGGTILATDLDSDKFGTQLATAGGRISFGLLPGEVSGLIHIEAKTIFGNVRGEAILTVIDDTAPSAPGKPGFLTRGVGAIGLAWPSNSEPDLAGYRVYFDTDTTGAPYTGTASILGRASPVDIGFDTTAVLTGLSPGRTYYVAVASYDLSGNESVVSSELQVDTASRSTSTIDTLSREVVFDFGDATRISVAIDSGAVGQDSVTVTYFGAADPFPHEFSGFTAPLLYLEITTSLSDSSFVSTITVDYTDSLLLAQGITDEANLKFAFYHEPTGSWNVPTDGQVVIDAANNRAKLTIRHFSLWALAVITPTGIKDLNEDQQVPSSYELIQNYPNPFNPSTSIRYALPESGHVTLKVYNIIGQEVITLVSRVQSAGRYTVSWTGINGQGRSASSGLYFYRLAAKPLDRTAPTFIDMKKMMLVK